MLLCVSTRALSPADSLGEPSVRRGVLLVLMLVALTRLTVITAAYAGGLLAARIDERVLPPLAKRVTPIQRDYHAPGAALHDALQRELGDLRPLCRWDGGHYLSVILNGYSYTPAPLQTHADPSAQHNIAFFPLYPLISRTLTPLMSAGAALVTTSNLSALAASIVLYLMVRAATGHAVALLSVALTFCWPGACFYSFAYAESLTLLLMVLTMHLATRHQFLSAALLCGLATAARPTALWLAPLLVVICVQAQWRAWRAAQEQTLRRAAPAAAVCCAVGLLAISGILAYFAYLTWRFGSPRVYADNYLVGWRGAGPFVTSLELYTGMPLWNRLKLLLRCTEDFPLGLIRLTDPIAWNVPLSLAVVGVSLVGLFRGPRWLRPWLALAPLVFMQRYLASAGNGFALESMARYLTLAPAAFIFLAYTLRRAPLTATLLAAALMLLQANFALQFGLGEWCG